LRKGKRNMEFDNIKIKSPEVDEAKLASMYTEFADEDRELAESGIADYTNGLVKEDQNEL
jgi:hypothetical protein